VCDKDLDVLLEPWSSGFMAKGGDGYWTFIERVEDLECLWQARRSPVEALGSSKRF